ncbi:ATP-dependent helicase [Candidatus Gottesmanbacteria bacterium]|nr:ATP-dependent helicase [Candidatus Gottesmanbacteria bacterium]
MVKTFVEEHKLNEEQKKAVEFGDGPILIIAGAGTGKTTVVTERIKHIISSGSAHPSEILALTFTEKAAREMEERVDMALPYGVIQMWISTFHAFCDRILRNEAINIGLDPVYKLMTEAETILFFRKNLFKFDLSYFRPYGNPTKFISGMIQHFSRLKDEDVIPQQYLRYTHNLKSQISNLKNEEEEEFRKTLELANAYKTYEELKVKEGLMDYADLISHTLKLFRTRRNILKQYQEQFKYILIDEFQDTNFAQNELGILLAGERKNITVVGDDDQAIYRWRGAAISNIIQFRKHFSQAKIIVLTKNYRSTKEILDRSYDLIQHNNPDRLEVAENIDKKLESMRRMKGETIGVMYADRVENEAEEVAKTIKNLKLKIKNDWSDFAILVRANNYAEPFSRALSRAGIPYQFLGPGQLFRQPEVKDLIAYLKVLYNFEDSVAMYRVLTMDWLDVTPRDVAGIINDARKSGISIFEACEKRTDEKVVRLVEMIHRHLGLIKKETAGQILYYFLQDTGLLKQLTSYKSTKEEKIAQNIAKFFSKLKTYETEHEDANVYALVDWIDLSMNMGESPMAADIDWSQNNAVNILTIHSAKGLEFPVVFLVHLVSSRFPSMERREQIPIPDAFIKEILPEGDFHLQEERRLFYVGMTRARDILYFTAAKYYGEGKREKKLSPFIGEALGEETVRQLDSKTVREAKQLLLLDWEKKEEPQVAAAYQPITYLSYSQLNTFTTCPLQYKYRYILRIPIPPSAALAFGDMMHKTVRAFYELVKNGDHPTKDTLLQLLNKQWLSVGFGDKAYEKKMKDHGRELLVGFYEKGYDPKKIPKDMEQSFKIKITPRLSLGGKIDRIDELGDGKIEIIDYKTGQAPKSKNPAGDVQLTVYALAATDEGMYQKKPQDVIV